MEMQKANMVRNGGMMMKLPIGFRFHPTDEELVVHYLNRKIYSFPLPASVIPDLDVFQTNPWDLPGDSKEKRYFFCKRSKKNVNKCKGITGSGYWKAMGKDKYIISPASNQAVGVKKSLVFCQGKRPRGLRTHWVMHEYRLAGSQTIPNSTEKFMMEMEEEWVVCRIYQKMWKSKNKGVKSQVSKYGNVRKIRPSIIDTMKMEDGSDSGPPQPSSASSCSSGITEVSSKTSSDQEETSAYNFSFSSLLV
ncbi:hypothetical protein ACSBR2_010779 [Camellia fascicularis]